jgi:Flp pilus assembly protein TadD
VEDYREINNTWLAMTGVGHYEEARKMLEALLESHPDDPQILVLLAPTLSMVGDVEGSVVAARRTIECGWDDPTVLVRAASSCFGGGDLKGARKGVDRAKELKPRRFIFGPELRELDRNLRHREKNFRRERDLTRSFDTDPTDLEVARELVRLKFRSGRNYFAYHVVSRALLHHPRDRRLRRLRRKLVERVPADARAEAEEWARSGDSIFIPDDEGPLPRVPRGTP